MITRRVAAAFTCLFCLVLPFLLNANERVDAKKLTYLEVEAGIEPYTVRYTVSDNFVRIDDESDPSGYIVFDVDKNKIFSVSHFDKSILVIPRYPAGEFKPEFKVEIEFDVLEDAPEISGNKVYQYRVKAVTSVTSETCMDVMLVPGLMPDIAKTLQAFQKIVSGQHAQSLERTPDEFRTPCYLVDQVHNQGDYFNKGFPIQEWHSNERKRQLLNFEDVKVEASIFDVPAEYRQYSLYDTSD